MSGFDDGERTGMRIRSILLAIVFLGLVLGLVIQAKMESRIERVLREQLADAKEQVLMLRDEMAALSQTNTSLERRLELSQKRAERAEAKLAEQEKAAEPPKDEAKETRAEPAKKNDEPRAEEKR